jgi:hypothetical protein
MRSASIGSVFDGRRRCKTAEPIARARVSFGDVSVVTGNDGSFILRDAAPPLILNVTAVGCATTKKTIRTTDNIPFTAGFVIR